MCPWGGPKHYVFASGWGSLGLIQSVVQHKLVCFWSHLCPVRFCRARMTTVCSVAQLHLTLCDPMDCSPPPWGRTGDPMDCGPPGSSVHGILQARILEWVTMPSSRGSSQPRDRTHVFCIAGGFFTTGSPGKPRMTTMLQQKTVFEGKRERKAPPWASTCWALHILPCLTTTTASKGKPCWQSHFMDE